MLNEGGLFLRLNYVTHRLNPFQANDRLGYEETNIKGGSDVNNLAVRMSDIDLGERKIIEHPSQLKPTASMLRSYKPADDERHWISFQVLVYCTYKRSNVMCSPYPSQAGLEKRLSSAPSAPSEDKLSLLQKDKPVFL